ncbi:helix-turn-helix domain-containing protein [Streptomyces sp. NPDC007920]|uniref:helix-turn-helix domain-containing protein n=1 Tax=unclassified Streptomyces TaxID=2593676 RepID=UPI0036E8172F
MVAAQRDLWRPTEVLAAFQQVGFNPSLSKVAALWSGTPVTVRLDDLDKMCAALNCSVADRQGRAVRGVPGRRRPGARLRRATARSAHEPRTGSAVHQPARLGPGVGPAAEYAFGRAAADRDCPVPS